MAEVSGGAAPVADVGGGAVQQGGGDGGPTPPRMLKLMLDGKETEFPESEVVGNFKRGRESAKLLSEADRRRSEALKERTRYEGLHERMKRGGPEAVEALRALGVDVGSLAERYYLDQIHQERMTPEERREAELQAKIRGYEDKEAKAAEEKRTAEQRAEEGRHVEQFAGVFTEAMNLAGFPKESASALFPAMARLYVENERAGLESTPQEMAHHAVQGFRTTLGAATKGLKGPALLEFLGPDTVREVLTANLQRSSDARVAPRPRAPGIPPRPVVEKRTEPPKRGTEEWFRSLQDG